MNLLDLPSAEEVEAGISYMGGVHPEIDKMLRQFAALIQLFKASEGTPRADIVAARSNGRDIEQQDYYAALDELRLVETAKNVLAAELAKAVDDYGVAQHAREHLREELARARADERERCAKVLDDQYAEWAKRAYPPPDILPTLAARIRALPPTEGKKA